MKAHIPKTFKLLKFLNRNHGILTRILASGLAWPMAFLATGRPRLAREVAALCLTKNDFKLAARRGAWYFRRSWINLDVSADDYFDFTEGLSDADLDQVEHFLQPRRRVHGTSTAASDQMFLNARRLDNGAGGATTSDRLQAFHDSCEAVLAVSHAPALHQTKPPKPRKGDFPKAHARRALHDFAALLPPDDIPWFVISGTFLGLVREQDFLAHDYDIDLGLFETDTDVDDVLERVARSDKFVLKKFDYHQSQLVPPPGTSNATRPPYIFKIIHRSGVHIDLFIHYEDRSSTTPKVWHGSSLHRWENTPFKLVAYDFNGLSVFGPDDADTYLTENYGDWRTPVSDFNCTTDTPNLRLVPHPISIAIFLKRLAVNSAENPRETARLTDTLSASGLLQHEGGQYIFARGFMEERMRST